MLFPRCYCITVDEVYSPTLNRFQYDFKLFFGVVFAIAWVPKLGNESKFKWFFCGTSSNTHLSRVEFKAKINTLIFGFYRTK